MAIRIGISGWRYEPWRGVFYPDNLPQRLELSFASRILSSIEINGSFYSLQRPEYFAQWHDETPGGFVFAVKGPKYITHFKRLMDVATPLANFFASGVFELRNKLGPLLWQFPPQLPFIADRFDAFFAMLPRDTDAAEALARQDRGEAPDVVRAAAAKMGPKIEEMIEDFAQKLDAWVVSAGEELHREILEVLNATKSAREQGDKDDEASKALVESQEQELDESVKRIEELRGQIWALPDGKVRIADAAAAQA